MDDLQRDPQLFFTSLDPLQTNPVNCVRESPAERAARRAGDELARTLGHYAYVVPPISPEESHWRHGDWQDERTKVRDALLASGMSENRRNRFDNCGSDAVVEWNAEEGRHRVRANYCGDRFCKPCARARAATVRQNLAKWMEGETCRFVTLTLKPEGRTLIEALNHLYASFVRLRASQTWRRAVTGGGAVTEIKRGSGAKCWHVHLHAIICGSYIEQADLSEAWRQASKGSFIVDVRRVKNGTGACAYLTKYVSKGIDPTVLGAPDDCVECVVALRGRRLLLTFGNWHGRGVERLRVDRESWVKVGRLVHVLHCCWRGETWASGIVQSLTSKRDEVDAKADDPQISPANSGSS